jgi:hypothetical protein
MSNASWRFLVLMCVALANSAFARDATAPDLVSLVMDTPAVDTSAGPATVRFTVQGTNGAA